MLFSTRHSICYFSVQIYYSCSWVSKYWICCLRRAHKPLYFISTHSVKRLKRGIWCDENVVTNSKTKQKGPEVQKWPQGGLHGYILGRNKALFFALLSIDIFHIPNHYYDINSYVYSGLPVLAIPTGAETKLRILLKEDSWLIFLFLSCFQLSVWSLFISEKLIIKCFIWDAVLSPVCFSQFSQNFCNWDYKSATGQNLVVMLCIEMECFENQA